MSGSATERRRELVLRELKTGAVVSLQDVGVGISQVLPVLFQALLQNCLLAEVAGTWRLGAELKDAVKEIKNQDVRKKMVAILERLADPNNCRFTEIVTGFEEDYDSTIAEMLATQSENDELDLIVSESDVDDGTVESTAIVNFNQSNFSTVRSSRAVSGLTYAPGSRTAEPLLNEAFGRLLKHTDRLEIYDRVIGLSFGGNFHEALGHWCTFFKSKSGALSLTLHTTGNQVDAVQRKLDEDLEDRDDVSAKVVGHLEEDQPHERFLRGGGFTLNIGRGVDLFDRDGNCRDVKISLSGHGEFTREWRSLAAGG